MSRALRFLAALSCFVLCASSRGAFPQAGIEIATLDAAAPNYATFTSDIPHATANAHGIFVVYLSHEETGILGSNWGKVNTWVLKRSTDGGETFSTVFAAPPRYGKAPEIETDENDNVYLFDGHYAPQIVDPHGMDLLVYRFSPADGYRNPVIWSYPDEAAGKFNALYDSTRHQFYYIGFAQRAFLVLGMDGRVLRRFQLFRNGRLAGVQYVQLAMDGPRLYVAWTTMPFGDCGGGPTNWHCPLPVYYTIHFIWSDDGGKSWQAPGGHALALPVVADIEGPVPNVDPPADLGKQSARLASFAAHHGVVHFLFQLHPSQNEIYEAFTASPFVRIHYDENRFGPPAKSGGFGGGGDTAFGYDGFLTQDSGALYAVVQDASKQSRGPAQIMPLFVLKSRDNGASWTEVARATASFAGAGFISGPRRVSPRYGIVGVFTGSANGSWAPNGHQAMFFRVPSEVLNR